LKSHDVCPLSWSAPLDVWWEDGFAQGRADGFVEAMRDAVRAYLRFAGAEPLEWAPHLAAEKRLFLTRP
jgi:hypothetical protein